MASNSPSITRALFRGCTLRCPLCGGGHLFRHWIHFVKRCPTCGFAYEREQGFFMGGWLTNLVVTEVLLFGLLMTYIYFNAQDKDVNMPVFIGIGAGIALLFPVVFYPFSRTIWSATEILAVKPTPEELEAAKNYITQRDGSAEA